MDMDMDMDPFPRNPRRRYGLYGRNRWSRATRATNRRGGQRRLRLPFIRDPFMSKLPTPPTKAPSGYSLFVRESWQIVREHESNGAPVGEVTVPDIALRWQNLPAEEKQEYMDRARQGQAQYSADIQLWRQTRSAMVRPRTPYVIFLKDYCRQNPNVPFLRLVTGASLAWRALDETQRNRYRIRYQRVLEGWRREREEVILTNRPVNANWMVDLLAQMDREEAGNPQEPPVEGDPAEGQNIADGEENDDNMA